MQGEDNAALTGFEMSVLEALYQLLGPRHLEARHRGTHSSAHVNFAGTHASPCLESSRLTRAPRSAAAAHMHSCASCAMRRQPLRRSLCAVPETVDGAVALFVMLVRFVWRTSRHRGPLGLPGVLLVLNRQRICNNEEYATQARPLRTCVRTSGAPRLAWCVNLTQTTSPSHEAPVWCMRAWLRAAKLYWVCFGFRAGVTGTGRCCRVSSRVQSTKEGTAELRHVQTTACTQSKTG